MSDRIKHGFGRLAEADVRILRKTLPKVSATIRTTSKRRERLWSTFSALDQDTTSQCVVYAGIQWLMAAPIQNKVVKWFNDPSILYKLCQKNDGITHDKNPSDDGTTVGGLFKVLKQEGFVKEYLYAGNEFGPDQQYYKGTELVDACISHILKNGPVVVGTPWLETMNDDLIKDFLQVDPTFGSVGGHSYVLRGVDLDKTCPDKSTGAFRMINSWGQKWGDNGEAWISFRDADVLFSFSSEVVTAVELLNSTRIG
jgi:Cysteine protease